MEFGRPRASGGHPRAGWVTAGDAASSPRERGSSRDECLLQRRPRASGGHPATAEADHARIESSPRERGSSTANGCRRAGPNVVPARAGVIRGGTSSLRSRRCRPRASGGHPNLALACGFAVESSPRERGSSARRDVCRGCDRVVPARAGVIPVKASRPPASVGRPRASGGHPAWLTHGLVTYLSSPRERGSSRAGHSYRHRPLVVPARAGVIRKSRSARPSKSRRPRASGGHPRTACSCSPPWWSSPRERGSSIRRVRLPKHRHVVPARAGVIRSGSWWGSTRVGRPRASGGHPNGNRLERRWIWSSPRERGSSTLTTWSPSLSHVVPARAGVIPSITPPPRAHLGRPRASGGHPQRQDGRLRGGRSSPREP